MMSTSSDHKKLLWEYATEGNKEMVNYMLVLPEIRDFKMEDGTTAFVMALSRQDSRLVEVLLTSKIQSEIDSVLLAQRALTELNKHEQSDKKYRILKLKEALSNGLKLHHLEDPQEEETPIEDISNL